MYIVTGRAVWLTRGKYKSWVCDFKSATDAWAWVDRQNNSPDIDQARRDRIRQAFSKGKDNT